MDQGDEELKVGVVWDSDLPWNQGVRSKGEALEAQRGQSHEEIQIDGGTQGAIGTLGRPMDR